MDRANKRNANQNAKAVVASAAPIGRPPRKDANEMSISMESSKSSLAAANNTASFIRANSEDLNISQSRDRMALSNNPFTSSGSFTAASFNGSGGSNNSTNQATVHAIAANATAASRYRMTYGDIGRAPAEDAEEYEEDFEDEVVEKYTDNHHYQQQQQQHSSSYDYKRGEEKKGHK